MSTREYLTERRERGGALPNGRGDDMSFRVGRTFEAYIVDWSDLERAASSGVSFWLFDPTVDAGQDVGSDILIHVPATKYDAASPVFGNLKAAVDAGTKYDRLRTVLDPVALRVWDEVLVALFWWGEEGGRSPRVDLRERDPSEFLFALRPETVVQYDDLVQSIPWSALSTAYRQTASEPRWASDFDESRWLASQEAFEVYIRSWTELLRKARGLGRAIVAE